MEVAARVEPEGRRKEGRYDSCEPAELAEELVAFDFAFRNRGVFAVGDAFGVANTVVVGSLESTTHLDPQRSQIRTLCPPAP